MNYTFDKLNRITSRKITNSVEYNTAYGYVQGASAYGTNATTPLVASITQGSGTNAFNLAYTYDSRGNITSETRNSVTTTYEYDKLGQLVRVNDKNDTTEGLAINTIAGGISGAIGGKGANLNALEATWNATNKQIQREIRRRNTEYATKRLIMYQATKRSIIRSMAFSAVRYLAGGLLSGEWKKWVQDYA